MIGYDRKELAKIMDGVLVLELVLELTRVLFSALSCTLYFAKFMSTCSRTYLSTVTKIPVLMSTLRVLLSTCTFFKFQSERGKKVNCFSGSPTSVLNFLVCLFSDLKIRWPHLFFFRCQNQKLAFLCLK